MIVSVARALALTWLVTGCAALPSEQATTTAAAAAAVRPYHESIDLAGRLSVRYQRGGQEEAMHGSFTWSQTPSHTRISLHSPLGQTIAVIEVSPGSAILTQAGQAPQVAADADGLAAATLGWPLPIAGLRHWLQGVAIDAQGRHWTAPARPDAEVLTQDGWRIVYASWGEAIGSAPPPRRIDLARQTAHAGPVALRLIIDSWQPG